MFRFWVRKILSYILMMCSENKKIVDFIMWPLMKRVLFGYKETVAVGDGIKMRLFADMADRHNKILMFYSDFLEFPWESVTVEIFRELVKNKRCVATAGACLGYYPLIASKVNPAAVIYAFEPAQKNFSRFKYNLSINNFTKNIFPIHAALGNKDGQVNISDDNAQSAVGYTTDAVSSVEIVDSYTLDNFFKDKDTSPDLILLDVEGMEKEVFDGASGILNSDGLDIIFEILKKNPALKNSYEIITQISNKLKNFGYNLYLILDEYNSDSIKDLKRSKSNIKIINFDIDFFWKNTNYTWANVLATKNKDVSRFF